MKKTDIIIISAILVLCAFGCKDKPVYVEKEIIHEQEVEFAGPKLYFIDDDGNSTEVSDPKSWTIRFIKEETKFYCHLNTIIKLLELNDKQKSKLEKFLDVCLYYYWKPPRPGMYEPNAPIAIAHTGWYHQFNEEQNEPNFITTERAGLVDVNDYEYVVDNSFEASSITIAFGKNGKKEINISLENDELILTGDIEDMNEAAEVFFYICLKDIVNNYIKNKAKE